MKLIKFLIILIPIIGFSQIEPESEPKTAFRESMFGGKYSHEILDKLLKEDCSNISINRKNVTTIANDLYYQKSTPYNYTGEFYNKFKYLTPLEEKVKPLDSLLKDNPKFIKPLSDKRVFSEFLSPINNWKIFYKKNTVFFTFSSNKKIFIHKFKFDQNLNLIFRGFGYTINKKDTLLYKQSIYDYDKGKLSKEVNNIYRDYYYREISLKESEVITYKNEKISSKVKQKFSEKNIKISEDVTECFFKTNKLLKTITHKKSKYDDFKKSHTIITNDFKRNKIITSKTSSKNKISIRKNKYDKKNRLIFSSYKEEDKKGNKVNESTIDIEYKPNNYIYRYKENFIITRGRKRLPLQYELSFTFI